MVVVAEIPETIMDIVIQGREGEIVSNSNSIAIAEALILGLSGVDGKSYTPMTIDDLKTIKHNLWYKNTKKIPEKKVEDASNK